MFLSDLIFPVRIDIKLGVGIYFQMLSGGFTVHLADHKIDEFRKVRELLSVRTGTEPRGGIILATKIAVRFFYTVKIKPRALGIAPVILHTLALNVESGCDERAEKVHIVRDLALSSDVLT